MQEPAAINGEKPTISVFLSDRSPEYLKAFKCSICGKTVFEYFTWPKMIIPGKANFSKPPVVIQCAGVITIHKDNQEFTSRCKARYYVN